MIFTPSISRSPGRAPWWYVTGWLASRGQGDATAGLAAPILADQQARPADVRRGARQTHPRRNEVGSSRQDQSITCIKTFVWRGYGAKSKHRNRIRLERASQKQSSDTHERSYDRVKLCRERKINAKASERVNVDVFAPTSFQPMSRQTQCSRVLQAPSRTVGFSRWFHTLSSIQATNTSLAVVPQSPVVVHTSLGSRTLGQAASIKDCRPLGCGSRHLESSPTRVTRRGGLRRQSVSPEHSCVVAKRIGNSSRRDEACEASKSHRCQHSRDSQKVSQEAASASFQEEGRARRVSDYGAGQLSRRQQQHVTIFYPASEKAEVAVSSQRCPEFFLHPVIETLRPLVVSPSIVGRAHISRQPRTGASTDDMSLYAFLVPAAQAPATLPILVASLKRKISGSRAIFQYADYYGVVLSYFAGAVGPLLFLLSPPKTASSSLFFFFLRVPGDIRSFQTIMLCVGEPPARPVATPSRRNKTWLSVSPSDVDQNLKLGRAFTETPNPRGASYALKLRRDWPGTKGGAEPATKNRTCPIAKPVMKSDGRKLQMTPGVPCWQPLGERKGGREAGCVRSIPGMKRAGETGDPRANPPTSGIAQHDSHTRKSGSDPAGIPTRTVPRLYSYWFSFLEARAITSQQGDPGLIPPSTTLTMRIHPREPLIPNGADLTPGAASKLIRGREGVVRGSDRDSVEGRELVFGRVEVAHTAARGRSSSILSARCNLNENRHPPPPSPLFPSEKWWGLSRGGPVPGRVTRPPIPPPPHPTRYLYDYVFLSAGEVERSEGAVIPRRMTERQSAIDRPPVSAESNRVFASDARDPRRCRKKNSLSLFDRASVIIFPSRAVYLRYTRSELELPTYENKVSDYLSLSTQGPAVRSRTYPDGILSSKIAALLVARRMRAANARTNMAAPLVAKERKWENGGKQDKEKEIKNVKEKKLRALGENPRNARA
ncbi:hypothetical protein PR048_032294 [Dryococelus australis]|uniref:Uncharacterized protein n=1 Tax=Dryococelus australis TaxID=614101 RepID=A0ABQ9G1T9_9NEOP|nr:hypothetical protein PR048_032294 [Dryococelus australis]